ncbi:cyanophycinase [Nostoc sp. WHI]|jgi:cyanophycinase|nr:cyanophycinase [Nostoc sp. WHI]
MFQGFSLFTSLPASAKSLVLIGGGLKPVLQSCNNDPGKSDPSFVHTQAIYQKMIELAGGSSKAKIGVITAASDSPSNDKYANDPCKASNYKDNGIYYVKAFKKLGAADAQVIPIDLDHISNKNSPEVVKQVNSMTGFFFGGGDQSRLIESFLNKDNTDSTVLTAIRRNYDSGAAIFGTSAGTAVQAGGSYVRNNTVKLPMITGGESYEALLDKKLCKQNREALSNKNYCPNQDDLSYYPEGGFGFFKYGILDTHFAERGRQGRFVRLAWNNSINDAYAPDENTALVVTDVDTPNVKMSVVGERGVNIFDLSNASPKSGACSRADINYWRVCGVKYTYLTEADQYTPLTKTVYIAMWKSPLTGLEHYDKAKSPSQDILSSPDNHKRENPRELIEVAEDLFDSRSTSTYGETYEHNPIFRLTLAKEKSFESTGYYGIQDEEKFYSFKNLLLGFYVNQSS